MKINKNGLDVVIESTRWCNMACPHCIRGDKERIRIKKNTIDEVFRKFDYINTLTLSGGEPALAIDLIEYALQSARHHNVTIDNFYITTNGTVTSRRFLNSLRAWYLYCDSNEVSGLRVSLDKYHDDIDCNAKYIFEEFKEYELQYIEESIHLDFSGAPDNENYLISDGNAAWNYPASREIRHDIEGEEWEDETILRGNIYINVYGELISTCNISYQSQREREEFKIGSVFDDVDADLENFVKKNSELIY